MLQRPSMYEYRRWRSRRRCRPSFLFLVVVLFLAFHCSLGWVQQPSVTSNSVVTRTTAVSSSSSPLPPLQKQSERANSKQRTSNNDDAPGRRPPRRTKQRGQQLNDRSVPDKIPRLSDVLTTNTAARGKSKAQRKNSGAEKRPRSKEAPTANRSTSKQPWRAGYYTSLKTQQNIKNAGAFRPNTKPIDRAIRVLKAFHAAPPEKCNAANLVCALTLSAKVVRGDTTDEFRELLFRTTGVLKEMMDQSLLSARQLCNTVWAIAKLFVHDETILPPEVEQAALSSDENFGHAEAWDMSEMNNADSHEKQLDDIVESIASQLTSRLGEDCYVAKEGELCMACWAFGTLKPRRRPPGWRHRPQVASTRTRPPNPESMDVLKFERWSSVASGVKEECTDFDAPTVTDTLFDAIGLAMTEPRLEGNELLESVRVKSCQWRELANMAWAFASHGRSCSMASQNLLLEIASETSDRLREGGAMAKEVLSRDIAQIIWGLGTLQSDKFRLADGLIEVVDALVVFSGVDNPNKASQSPFESWSCADLVQVILSLAHARMDEQSLLRPLYAEAARRLENDSTSRPTVQFSDQRKSFFAWEVSILLWAQARLHLKEPQGRVFESFAPRAAAFISDCVADHDSLSDIGIGPQEQANLVWSLTLLEEYDDKAAVSLIARIFGEAAISCEQDGLIHLEHAHQLWQALFLLEEECPQCVADVPTWFYEYLQEKWLLEKARAKVSSARHRSLSQALDLMGVQHKNEHDEDIDVAIVLKPHASWSHETTEEDGDTQGDDTVGVKLAVEFDGPNHFTRQRATSDETESKHVRPAAPRALGHTVLKYRLLKKQGWTVVRVPYYEFDKIPFWASMERQRYLQRLLKTHGRLKFSESDASEYKPPVPNRSSRFD